MKGAKKYAWVTISFRSVVVADITNFFKTFTDDHFLDPRTSRQQLAFVVIIRQYRKERRVAKWIKDLTVECSHSLNQCIRSNIFS